MTYKMYITKKKNELIRDGKSDVFRALLAYRDECISAGDADDVILQKLIDRYGWVK